MSDAFVRPPRAVDRGRACRLEGLIADTSVRCHSRVGGRRDPRPRGLARRRARHGRPRDLRPYADRRPGVVTLDGEPIAPSSPAEAMAGGVGFVSSRRAEESLAPSLEVRENIYMNPAASGRGVLEFDSARDASVAMRKPRCARFSIKTGRRRTSRSPPCPAATSRRWCSRAGWRPT